MKLLGLLRSILIMSAFVAWVYFYLWHVRPVINGILFRFLPGYPALLHLLPIFGDPIVIIGVPAVVVWLFWKLR